MNTFDANLSDEQKRKAIIMRRSIRPDKIYMRPDPPPPGKAICFDDIFNSITDLARAQELRKKCKAEIYWKQASMDEKQIIRDAVIMDEPYKGDEIITKTLMNRDIEYIIHDTKILNYVIKNVLAL